VIENSVLRGILGPERDEVIGEWRTLQKEKIYALYSSPDIILVIKSRRELGSLYSTYGERRDAYGVLVGKTEGKRPL
jgi:hypothetical protein